MIQVEKIARNAKCNRRFGGRSVSGERKSSGSVQHIEKVFWHCSDSGNGGGLSGRIIPVNDLVD